jgi:MFS family permease
MQLCGVSGWLADRFPVGVVFAAGFLVWSLATITTGFLSGFAAIYTVRLLLGAGESVAYPCYSRIFATNLPEHHRGRANALLDAGTKVGPAVGTFIGGLLLVHFGWRIFFILLGAGSLLWLVPWLKFMPADRHVFSKTAESLPSTRELLSYRSAWGAFLGHFCGNYRSLHRIRSLRLHPLGNLANIGWTADGRTLDQHPEWGRKFVRHSRALARRIHRSKHRFV